MSDSTPPIPPLPDTSAEEAARASGATAPASRAAYDPASDPDDTGVPKLAGDIDDIGRGFFGALFDISFRTFITRRLASAFYVVGLVAIAIGFIVYFVSGIFRAIGLLLVSNIGGGIALLVATIIIVPIATFLAIILLRFIIEGIVALIAIAENTERTAEHTRGPASS